MAMPSSSSSAASQAQNSPRSRQSRRSSAARGVPTFSDLPSPPPSSSGVIDQDQFVASSSTAISDYLPAKDANATVAAAASTCFAEDGSTSPAGGADAPLESSENGAGAKKPAWNKPSSEAIAEVGAVVMGAESWPALSESARASPKSPSTSSLKALSQASVSVSQEMAVGFLSSPKEGTSGISSPNSNGNHRNHVVPSRQRSMKRGGGSSSHSSMPANDSISQAPPVIEAPPNVGKSTGLVGESSKDNTYRDAGQRGGGGSYGGNEVHPQRSFRRSNSGPLLRGDGPHHHRRDQDRGKQDWNSSQRNFGSRENHAPQRRVGSRPFLRGPAPNAPFIPPPPPSPVAVRPFVTSLVYTDMPSPVYYVPGPHPDSFRPMPMVPISSMFFPMPDPYLYSKIVNQIDYYFSNENLVKDTFLRQNMDGEGWVSIKLIAGFKKVTQLTDNIQLILQSIQASNVVEVQGDKVRRKNDWIKWIMPPAESSVTSPGSTNKPSQNMLAAHLNSVTLDEKAAT